MKTALIGVGQAGGKLVQRLAEHDERRGFGAVRAALAVNTAEADLQSLSVDTHLVGADRVSGHGVGGDNELGALVMDENATEVLDAVGPRLTSGIEAVVLVAGLGGGTGSGGAPVLARELKRVYDVPVYAVGVLPGRDEGALYQVNAGRSLKTLAREADALLLVDNDAWRESDESVAEGYDRINERIARRFGLLLAAGERVEGVAESVVDTSEVVNTLRGGGTAALGYASTAASEESAENINAVTSATRSALLSGTSLPDATDAAAALLVVAGRPGTIPRKGVERARSWLGEELGTMQVRGGDLPLDSDRLATLVLLGGVERSGRVDRFLERADRASEEADTADRGRDDSVESLTSDDIDGLL